jgi:hypothetical protein
MLSAGLFPQINLVVWDKTWVVHSEAVGDGRHALKYLAAYLFRVAISDRRILSCDNGEVTFSWRPSGSRRDRSMTLPAEKFLSRFLQHVLPTGFQKVRTYGFLSPAARHTFEHVRWLATIHAKETFVLNPRPRPEPLPVPPPRCPDCGTDLLHLGFVRFVGRALFDTS